MISLNNVRREKFGRYPLFTIHRLIDDKNHSILITFISYIFDDDLIFVLLIQYKAKNFGKCYSFSLETIG